MDIVFCVTKNTQISIVIKLVSIFFYWFIEDPWKCMDGETEIPYINWSGDQPDNKDGNENCAQLWEFGFNDLPCDQIRSAVCKVPIY